MNSHTRRRLVFCAFLILFAAPLTVPAATIVVDSPADENAATPPNGNCTLREAILAANGNIPVDGCTAGEAAPTIDEIRIPSMIIVLSIAETGDASGGSLDLIEDVKVVGSGFPDTTISGAGANIVCFNVDAAATVELTDLCVREANAGGITNWGEMTLSRCWITQNSDDGVKSWGIATIDHCRISQNTYEAAGGGGVYNNGGMAILNSTIANNNGAGVTTVVGSLLVENSTVSGNNRGGVVGHGTIQILNSTISDNHTPSGVVVSAVSVTLDGLLFISNSTIVGNSADYGSGIYVQPNAYVQFQNSVIAGNSGSPDCFIYGTVLTTGGNVESPGNSCGLNDPNDQPNVAAEDLAIGPLANHGGPTRTRGLEPGSVAIDAGVSTGPTYDCPGLDQRGQPRSDGLCDTGAVEVQSGEEMIVIFVDGFESGDALSWTEVLEAYGGL